MTDVIKIAQDRRAKKLAEIEELMGQVEQLEEFIRFGKTLSGNEASSESHGDGEQKSATIAAE